MCLVVVDETVGGGIVRLDLAGLTELGKDGLCKLLAEFNAPLVEGVDIPDDALNKDLVLVHGNKGTKRGRVELLEHDRIGGLVALEDAVRNNVLSRVGTHLGADLLFGLADHQSLGLGKEVGKQNVVMVTERVKRLDGSEEITGDELGALVDELVEGMLAVGARLTPDDGASRCLYLLARPRDILAVRFHITLLEVGGETVHVLTADTE